MKTLWDLDDLKEKWLRDPCWDIEDTEGFEDYKAELRAYRINQEELWKAKEYMRVYNQAAALGIVNLGPKDDEPDLRLTRYLMRLEERIIALEKKTENQP